MAYPLRSVVGLPCKWPKLTNSNIPLFGKAWKDWLRGFKRRHPELSIKKPEACSIARATAFNPANVKSFFENLLNVCSRFPEFGDGTRIFILGETATATVQRPGKVIAKKGSNVSKVTSGSEGFW